MVEYTRLELGLLGLETSHECVGPAREPEGRLLDEPLTVAAMDGRERLSVQIGRLIL